MKKSSLSLFVGAFLMFYLPSLSWAQSNKVIRLVCKKISGKVIDNTSFSIPPENCDTDGSTCKVDENYVEITAVFRDLTEKNSLNRYSGVLNTSSCDFGYDHTDGSAQKAREKCKDRFNNIGQFQCEVASKPKF